VVEWAAREPKIACDKREKMTRDPSEPQVDQLTRKFLSFGLLMN